MVRRVKAHAAEDMPGYFRAFLRRIGVKRVQVANLRRYPLEAPDLTLHLSAAKLNIVRLGSERAGIDRLPVAYHQVDRILAQEFMQERRAAPRQAGDEDRLLDSLLENRGV